MCILESLLAKLCGFGIRPSLSALPPHLGIAPCAGKRAVTSDENFPEKIKSENFPFFYKDS
jgi:hypothetical protein